VSAVSQNQPLFGTENSSSGPRRCGTNGASERPQSESASNDLQFTRPRLVPAADRTRAWNRSTDSWPIQGFIQKATCSANATRSVTVPGSVAIVWDMVTGKTIGQPLQHEAIEITSANFSADGTKIVTAGGTTAQIWGAATAKPIGEPFRYTGFVNSANFSADGIRIVTASGITLQIWNAGTAKPVGQSLLSGSQETVSASSRGGRKRRRDLVG